VFGKLSTPAPSAPPAEQMDIEAADMRMLGDLAAHLATMPKSEQGALNILTVAASVAIDSGGAALSLARSLAGAGRKAVVVDAGSGSRDFAAALPNPAEGGLGELIAGKTSFGQAIQRDRASAAHLIGPGGAGLLNASAYERTGVVFNALGLTYDFVIVLSPSAERSTDVALLAKGAGAAILVSNVQDLATTAAHNALAAAGVGDVVLLLTDSATARPAERAS
jgi:Mrp family chromosome partitioning ATPase